MTTPHATPSHPASPDDRRRAPRLAEHLPLTLGDGPEGISVQTHTKNLSASGAYCTVNRFVRPMTKLKIKLDLPGAPAVHIYCEGVVVRVEPPHEQAGVSEYHIAIFFSDLAERDRLLIAGYVQRRSQTPPRGSS
ncbi:MAG: PilZ domain-containing protein [Candidatus Omnitrophica bacterium]|nr:PilZ domain-containing protein [Candidatus Omnitrophota bacterium]